MVISNKVTPADRIRMRVPEIFLKEALGLTVCRFHREWIRMANRAKDRFVCIMAPRQHGKTEVLIIGFMLYRMFIRILDMEKGKHDRHFSGLIISKSMPQSKQVLRRLKYRVMDSPVLREYLPVGREGAISTTQIIFNGRHRIVCRPYSDSVRGETIDVVTVDEAGTFDDKETFKYAIMSTVMKTDGKIVVIGTPTSQTDLLFDLFDNPAFVSKKYKALQGGLPLWAEEYPRKKLDKIKQAMGSLSFSREFMCEPLGEEDRIFPYSHIEQAFLPHEGWITEKRDGPTYWIGGDFAMSAQVGSDYSVFTIIEKDYHGVCRIVKMIRLRGKLFEEQRHIFEGLCETYKPIRVLVDERTFGKVYLQSLKAKGYPVEGYKFTPHGSKAHTKEELIMHLANKFEQKKILIPRGKECEKITNQLVKELLSFAAELNPRTGNIKYEGKAEHDDCVISLALAVYIATRYKVHPTHIRRSSFRR